MNRIKISRFLLALVLLGFCVNICYAEDNSQKIIAILNKLEAELKSSCAIVTYEFFRDGRYLHSMTELGNYPEKDLLLVYNKKEISGIQKKLIEIAIDRKKNPAAYETIAQYYNKPPKWPGYNPVVWSPQRISFDEKHLTSYYLLALEERIICPYIGKESFMGPSQNIYMALKKINEIYEKKKITKPEQYLEYLMAAYMLACSGAQDGPYETIRKFILDEITDFETEASLRILAKLYYFVTWQYDRDRMLNSVTHRKSYLDMINRLIKTEDPNSDFGRFLKTATEIKDKKDKGEWNFQKMYNYK